MSDEFYEEAEHPTKRRKAQSSGVWWFMLRITHSDFHVAQGFREDLFDTPAIRKDLEEQLAHHGDIDKWYYQLERGGETNRLHYQMCVHTTKRTRPGTLGKVLGLNVCPGIEVQACADWKATIKYCTKADTRVSGPWSNQILPYQGDDLKHELYPFQETIVSWVTGPPEDRKIRVVYDPIGGTGKTTLAKKLVFEKKASWLSIADCKDLMYQVVEEGPQKAYIIDIPRTKSAKVSMDEIYTVMEQLKNGMCLSTKYKGGRMLMSPPTVVIFTNHKIDRSKMSQDRWDIWQVDPATKTLIRPPPATPDAA